MSGEEQFKQFAAEEIAELTAPSKLKARAYSMLVRAQQQDGPLLDVSACKAHGNRLCVFEELVQIAPVGQTAKSAFFCSVCHARLLAEHFEDAPIWWPHCPYVRFQNR